MHNTLRIVGIYVCSGHDCLELDLERVRLPFLIVMVDGKTEMVF